MRIFIDIDGTCTDSPNKWWGNPRTEVIEKIKKLIDEGHRVVLWSVGGTKYAKEFAKKHGFKPFACIGKPDVMIDDKPTIRSRPIPILNPEEFIKKEFSIKEGRNDA